MKQKLNLIVYPKTIYTDIVGLPNPLLLGITIHYFNHSDTGLFMKIFIEGPSPWSSNAVTLGELGSGANAYVNLDNFTSRTKPASETTEVLTLTLRGYTDAGYSLLVYEFSRSLTIVFIKSDDGSWTQDFLNDFNDGTIQGWAAVADLGYGTAITSFAVATDYVLSTSYSLKCEFFSIYGFGAQGKVRVYKSFATPNRNTIYAIINVRMDRNAGAPNVWLKNLEIQINTTTLITLTFIGRLFDTVTAHYVPKAKWLRIVVPLPKSLTPEVRIVHTILRAAGGLSDYNYIWMDDFKIISK